MKTYSVKQCLGATMILLVFVGLFIGAAVNVGFLAALAIWSAAAFLTAWVSLGVYLLVE